VGLGPSNLFQLYLLGGHCRGLQMQPGAGRWARSLFVCLFLSLTAHGVVPCLHTQRSAFAPCMTWRLLYFTYLQTITGVPLELSLNLVLPSVVHLDTHRWNFLQSFMYFSYAGCRAFTNQTIKDSYYSPMCPWLLPAPSWFFVDGLFCLGLLWTRITSLIVSQAFWQAILFIYIPSWTVHRFSCMKYLAPIFSAYLAINCLKSCGSALVAYLVVVVTTLKHVKNFIPHFFLNKLPELSLAIALGFPLLFVLFDRPFFTMVWGTLTFVISPSGYCSWHRLIQRLGRLILHAEDNFT